MTITPDEFASVFSTVVGRRTEIVDLWQTSRPFTDLMLSADKGVLQHVARELELEYRPNFMTVDAVMYHPLSAPRRADYGYIQPTVLIEHENGIGRIFQEAQRLAVMTAPLKVLISYPATEAKHDMALKRYTDALQSIGLPYGNHLIIFGDRDGNGRKWSYYASRESFEPLVLEQSGD
jgi:hypothetical protein